MGTSLRQCWCVPLQPAQGSDVYPVRLLFLLCTMLDWQVLQMVLRNRTVENRSPISSGSQASACGFIQSHAVKEHPVQMVALSMSNM